jgi:DNA-binding CsgD family transcriptional regulator
MVGTTVIVYPRRKRDRAAGGNPHPNLTRRQSQVLELAMDGYSNVQIAETMGISVRTVTYHLKSIKARIEPGNIPGRMKSAQ